MLELSEKERQAGGVLDMDTKIISTITSHGPGYLDKEKETIVASRRTSPFKRALQPYGGIRMAVKACQDNGYEVDPQIVSSSPSTARPTTRACLTPTHRKCGPAAPATSSPAFPTPTAGAASSATTGG